MGRGRGVTKDGGVSKIWEAGLVPTKYTFSSELRRAPLLFLGTLDASQASCLVPPPPPPPPLRRYSGKELSVVWRGELIRRFVDRGGTESDADYVYETFRSLVAAAKRKARAV